MPEPWELTEEEASAEAERLDSRRREADRVASHLCSEMFILLNATEQELRAKYPENEVNAILAYRTGSEAEWSEWHTSILSKIFENLIERARDGEVHARTSAEERNALRQELLAIDWQKDTNAIGDALIGSPIAWLANESSQALQTPLTVHRGDTQDEVASEPLARLVGEFVSLLDA